MNKEVKITPNGIKQAIDDLLDEKERLQKRINKAIKYINDYENYCMEISHNIIAILKGEDK